MKFRSYTKVAAMAALLVVSTACSWFEDDPQTSKPSFMSPTSGPVGTLLTFTSTDFDLATVTSVTVNGTPAVIVSTETGTARALVMPGSTTGSVVVTNATGTKNATFTITTALPIATQQGAKLVGTGIIGIARLGWSVALSADGNTALLGGYEDDSGHGASWVFSRSGTAWTQQRKLVGTGNTGAAEQGRSVALSADGNTALVGGYYDNTGQSAAWVFTRSGSFWTQQEKLVGTGNTGAALQGSSVALSADGNTALVGGSDDNNDEGAAWVFTRSGTTWTQQGSKLVGTGNVGAAYQGRSVALSADGNTALVAGPLDNSNQGAVWVFTRSGTTWTQQGTKLVGTGNSGAAYQGFVALSADGHTALVGGNGDNSGQGAVWVFTRSGTTWSQQGAKLVGTGSVGPASQGRSVALSADGSTGLVGGPSDDSALGAAWVWVP